MFDKEALDKLFTDLRGRYEEHEDWEDILRQAHWAWPTPMPTCPWRARTSTRESSRP